MAFPAYYGATSTVASTAAVSPDFSSITAAGRQLWIAFRSCNQPISAPSGWSEVSNSPQGTGSAASTDATSLQVFKMDTLADGSETTVALADSGASNIAVGFATDPADIDVSAGDVEATGSTSVTFPAVTTAGPDRLILNVLSHDRDSTSATSSGQANASLANLTERFDRSTDQSNGGGLVLITGELATAGSTGSTTATLAAAVRQARITLALMTPAGGDTIAAGKASAGAAAHPLSIAASTVIAAGKVTASAAAHAVLIQTGSTLVLGKASASAQARGVNILQTTSVLLGKASASASAYAASITAGLRITGGKAVAAASALAAVIVQTLSFSVGKATASAQARAISVSDGSAPVAGSFVGGLIVNVGRLLSRF
jgi:hypothetical protein